MSQQAGGKGGTPPSGPAFDAAAATSGGQASPASREQFMQQYGSRFPTSGMADQAYQEYQSKGTQALGFQNAASADLGAMRPDQTNAFGSSVNWSHGPNGWQQSQSFGGPLGQAAQGFEGQIAQNAGTPLDNGAQARQHAEDAIYGRQTSRLDPRFAQQDQQMQSQLAAQGLTPGTQAYDSAYANFSRSKNDAYSTAMQDSITGGGQEAQRQQQMDLASRFAPEQQLAGLSQFTGQAPITGQSQYLPAAMAQYQGMLQKYGIDQAGKNSSMGGLANLGGTLGSAAIMA